MENLEKLNGVGKTTADKLRKAGYNTIDAIAEARPAVLAKKVGVFPAVAKRIVNAAKMIVKARSKEDEIKEEAISKLEEKRKEEGEIEEREEEEEEEEEKKPKGKIPLRETRIPILAEGQKEEDLFKQEIKDTTKDAAKYTKKPVKFKEKILNDAMKNKNFRQRLVNLIAKNLCDD